MTNDDKWWQMMTDDDKWWQMTAQWPHYHSAKYAIKSGGDADRPFHSQKDSWESRSHKVSGSANRIKLQESTWNTTFVTRTHPLWRASTCLGKSPDMLSIKKPMTPGMKTNSVTALLIQGWIDRTGICRIQSAASWSRMNWWTMMDHGERCWTLTQWTSFSENFVWTSCELHDLPFGFFGLLATAQESSWYANQSFKLPNKRLIALSWKLCLWLLHTSCHMEASGQFKTRFAQRRLRHGLFIVASAFSNSSPLHPLPVQPFLDSKPHNRWLLQPYILLLHSTSKVTTRGQCFKK